MYKNDFNIKITAQEAQPGRAELWRCLGYKFESYLEQIRYTNTR